MDNEPHKQSCSRELTPIETLLNVYIAHNDKKGSSNVKRYDAWESPDHEEVYVELTPIERQTHDPCSSL